MERWEQRGAQVRVPFCMRNSIIIKVFPMEVQGRSGFLGRLPELGETSLRIWVLGPMWNGPVVMWMVDESK